MKNRIAAVVDRRNKPSGNSYEISLFAFIEYSRIFQIIFEITRVCIYVFNS